MRALQVPELAKLLDEPDPPQGPFFCHECHRAVSPDRVVEYESEWCGYSDCHIVNIGHLTRLVAPRLQQPRPESIPEREWDILRMYYVRFMIVKEIAVHLGVSRERIKQLIMRGLTRLSEERPS